MNARSAFRSYWQLNPGIDFLNHGSFGATPTVVLRAQRSLQNALERDPIKFLAPERDLEPKLDAVRTAIALLVRASPEDLAFVRNATDSVNAVLRSFPLKPHDEIVVTLPDPSFEATHETGHGVTRTHDSCRLRLVTSRAGKTLIESFHGCVVK